MNSPCCNQPVQESTEKMYGDYTVEDYPVYICPACGTVYYLVYVKNPCPEKPPEKKSTLEKEGELLK